MKIRELVNKVKAEIIGKAARLTGVFVGMKVAARVLKHRAYYREIDKQAAIGFIMAYAADELARTWCYRDLKYPRKVALENVRFDEELRGSYTCFYDRVIAKK